MMPDGVSLIALLVLIIWRLVFTGILRWPLGTGIATRNQPHHSLLQQHLHRRDPAGAVVIQDNRFENTSNGVHAVKREYRAKIYLRRIVALTGATQKGNSYVLDVGITRFSVRDGYVARLRDATDPSCIYRETCFYSAQRGMPKAEQIAAALLQLKNNPALFDKWVAQDGLMFKADGTTVQPRAVIGWG
jgi:hypothetical protein